MTENTINVGGVSNVSNSTVQIAGRDINNLYQQLPTRMPIAQAELEAAKARLASLPTDTLPAPDSSALADGSRLPWPRNPLFVGREDELKQLAAQMQTGGTTIITTGIGGMGKTQLAIEFAHRYGRFFAGGVVWLSAERPANLTDELAQCVHLDGMTRNRPELLSLPIPDQAAHVLAALTGPLPRLLILDNLEDPDLLPKLRPPIGGCRVLVTSRKHEWPRTTGSTLHLDVLEPAESRALLRELAPHLTDADAAAVAAALDHLPLALHLAGNYLHVYHPRLDDYLAALADPKLLEHDSLTGRGTEDAPTGREMHVAKTFALSFKHLNPADPTDALALRLLTRAALFAPGEPIPTEVLNQTLGSDDAAPDPHDVTDARRRLLSVGLLETSGDDAVKLHRLLAAYADLNDPAPLADVERVLMREAYQRNETGLPAAMTPILAHLRHAAERAFHREDADAATLLGNLGYYLHNMGDYPAARPLYERALAIRERVLGPDHPKVATDLNNLALLLHNMGDYPAARPLYERALAIRERVLGPDHPNTATSLNNLAALLHSMGDYSAARPLYERALAIRERVLGPDHPDTAQSLNNLAELLRAMGDYPAARPYLERALAIRERVLGPDHPLTAQSLNNLAELLRAMGDYPAARPLLERALAIHERVLGPDHPNTATSLNNLALLLHSMGDTPAARPLYERALAICERVLGPDHPLTAQSLNNLALLLHSMGDYPAARPYFERALAIHERVLGPDHPDTAQSLNNLAVFHAYQGNFVAAIPLVERALGIRERTLGATHPDTRQTRESLANMRRAASQSSGDSDPGQALIQRILEWYQTPDWAASRAYLLAHQAELLSDAAEAKLALLIEQMPNNDQLKMHQMILGAARTMGIELAYAPLLRDDDSDEADSADDDADDDTDLPDDISARLAALQGFIATPNWAAGKDFVLANQAMLLDDQSLRLYVAVVQSTEDAQMKELLERHVAILVGCKMLGIEAAFAQLGG